MSRPGRKPHRSGRIPRGVGVVPGSMDARYQGRCQAERGKKLRSRISLVHFRNANGTSGIRLAGNCCGEASRAHTGGLAAGSRVRARQTRTRRRPASSPQRCRDSPTAPTGCAGEIRRRSSANSDVAQRGRDRLTSAKTDATGWRVPLRRRRRPNALFCRCNTGRSDRTQASRSQRPSSDADPPA